MVPSPINPTSGFIVPPSSKIYPFSVPGMFPESPGVEHNMGLDNLQAEEREERGGKEGFGAEILIP
jgi:hypothetical protein